ncbi:hypothetical protein M666_16475 [Cellulophaga baltica 18]|uniref:Uncharacterized protein n=1 Tax=Cellulophaga baltica 18 TaxID=1348584 RepID=A0AAU8RJ10_9FLAO|nr:hypothetical protein M666_16475 [Cellulophaga baltica 18]
MQIIIILFIKIDMIFNLIFLVFLFYPSLRVPAIASVTLVTERVRYKRVKEMSNEILYSKQ